jgi:hypothetical protein
MKRALIFSLSLAVPHAARAQLTVLGSGVEERAARPGETYSGSLRVRNDGARSAEARVYQTDYTFTADGTTRYGAPGSLPRSNARWIIFSPSQVRIPPGGEAVVGYVVTVPADAGLGGAFWSMLMVEGIAPGSAASTETSEHVRVQVGVRPSVRYGVQIATALAGPAPRIAFSNAHAFVGGRGKVLELDLTNAGETAYRPEIRVELFDEAGRPAGSFTSRRGLLYPGTSLRQRFELGALKAGSYQAMVVADAGGDQVYGAQYTLRL